MCPLILERDLISFQFIAPVSVSNDIMGTISYGNNSNYFISQDQHQCFLVENVPVHQKEVKADVLN